MMRIISVWVLCLGVLPLAAVQNKADNGKRVVSEIMFNGNKITRNETILREMVLKPGDV